MGRFVIMSKADDVAAMHAQLQVCIRPRQIAWEFLLPNCVNPHAPYRGSRPHAAARSRQPGRPQRQ